MSYRPTRITKGKYIMLEEVKGHLLKLKLQEIGEYTLKIRKLQDEIIVLLGGNT